MSFESLAPQFACFFLNCGLRRNTSEQRQLVAVGESTDGAASRTGHAGIECEEVACGDGHTRSGNRRRDLKSPFDPTTCFALLEVVESDVEHLCQELQLRIRPAILALANVRCYGFTRDQFPAWSSPRADGGGRHSCDAV